MTNNDMVVFLHEKFLRWKNFTIFLYCRFNGFFSTKTSSLQISCGLEFKTLFLNSLQSRFLSVFEWHFYDKKGAKKSEFCSYNFSVPPCCSLPFMVTQKCFNAINAHLNVCIILQIPKFLNNNHSRLTFEYTCKYSKKTIVGVSFKKIGNIKLWNSFNIVC